MFWKVGGLLVMPKNITNGSNDPLLVVNAAFHSQPFLICTLLHPYHKLSLVNTLAFPTLSIISKIKGNG